MTSGSADSSSTGSALFYQREAVEIVDYDLFQIEGCAEYFRGPRMSLEVGNYIAYLGAAQTFGTFCRHPFPDLITERVGLSSINLGIGGAGPDTFLGQPALMQIASNARLVVVQVMSGRSAPNRLLETWAGTSSLRRRDRPNDAWRWADDVWSELLTTEPATTVLDLIDETRRNWVASMRQLLDGIGTRKILLWISSRTPEYIPRLSSVELAFGAFPQLVNRDMLDQLTTNGVDLVEVVTRRGMPHRLTDKSKGLPVWINRPNGGFSEDSYYPSPAMHVDAAETLTPVIQTCLSDSHPADKTSSKSSAVAYRSGRISERRARVAFLLSHERSGSHLLKNLLSSHPSIASTGEVCNLDYVTEREEDSFFRFRRSIVQVDPSFSIPYMDTCYAVLDSYLEKLSSRDNCEVLIIDMKYGHCHNFSSYWQGRGVTDAFVDYVSAREIPLVHLYRRNVFDSISSAHLANQVGFWASDGTQNVSEKISLSRETLQREMFGRASEIINWKLNLQRTSHTTIRYEDLVSTPEAPAEIAREVASFISVHTSWTPFAPDQKMSPPVQEYLGNYSELEDLRKRFNDVDALQALWL